MEQRDDHRRIARYSIDVFRSNDYEGCGTDKLIIEPQTERYMNNHTHDFVESYDGLVGFGLDRSTNEKTIIYYLQKFSDDLLMQKLVDRLSDQELEEIFDLLTRLLKKHFSEPEYHRFFLKDEV